MFDKLREKIMLKIKGEPEFKEHFQIAVNRYEELQDCRIIWEFECKTKGYDQNDTKYNFDNVLLNISTIDNNDLLYISENLYAPLIQWNMKFNQNDNSLQNSSTLLKVNKTEQKEQPIKLEDIEHIQKTNKP